MRMKIIKSWFGPSARSRATARFGLSAAILLPIVAWANYGSHPGTATTYQTVNNVTYECKNTPSCVGTTGTCYAFSPQVNETCKAMDGSGSTYTYQHGQEQSSQSSCN
jgi:hypothetical protein